jgi:glycosyltransferase involved in cell wall biosynthesis
MMISIALCTYNGEKFLQEQLDSIADQSLQPGELVVCDDLSNDSTIAILTRFKTRAQFAVHIHRNEKNLGPVKNFEKAISLCRGDYIFLCDQDDVWLPNKIELSLKKMAQMEAVYGADAPILVHTDARVVDAKLNLIAESLWHFQKTNPEKGKILNRLLQQNTATGCTLLINEALKKTALPFAEDAMMHDWWLALVAVTFGHCECLHEPLVLYRQHGDNDTGAKSLGILIALQVLLDFYSRVEASKRKEQERRVIKQAQAFADQYRTTLSPRQLETIAAFIDLPARSWLVRKYLVVKYGLYYHDTLRNIGNLLLK